MVRFTFTQVGVWAAVFGVFGGANALGINCRGNSQCKGSARELVGVINTIGGGSFNNGQQIACVTGSLCAFFQGVPGGSVDAATTKTLAQKIIDHGCNSCGSVPLSDNNPATGILTFNFVGSVCANGNVVCPDTSNPPPAATADVGK
ncbi:killer toxin, Kp4/SMK-like protein, core [Lasiosphaeria ovina]|uniref:Killer toxin, Kp4/SMK-like protein, core n=1 Tax=Lasiosphaeria ovina TaxID=92902 RepID=A0AAE0TYC2_9PEZI|nr:killer toxin, Kp4/SMK-like protein, core [Lasiosphaeria ovina]